MRRKGLSIMDKQTIEKIVNDLLVQSGYNDGIDAYVDIAKLARFAGFRVGETSLLPFKDDGFISISKDKKKKIIGVNNDRAFEEKRFIVAHELAHYFLHYKDSYCGDAIMHREHVKGKNAQENDADYFAACILMPKESFSKLYHGLCAKKHTQTQIIDYLQIVFRTPRESIKRRIEEIAT